MSGAEYSAALSILRGVVERLFALGMSSKEERNNRAFELWYALRRLESELRRRGALELSHAEKIEYFGCFDLAHKLIHDFANDATPPSAAVCGCVLAEGLRYLTTCFAAYDVARELNERRALAVTA